MKIRNVSALVAIPLALSLLAACSGADSPDNSGSSTYEYNSDQENLDSVEGVKFGEAEMPSGEGERIGVVLKALSNQYWQGIELGVNAAAKEFGVEVVVQAASSETAHTEQLTIAQTMVNDKYDAYIFAPESTSNLTPALELIAKQGAPVVNVDDARIAATVYVGPDHELNGKFAADHFAQMFPDGGKVAQIEGQAGSSAAILRIAGFTAGVEAHENLELVASVPGNWDANQAFGATQQVLQQHPDVVGIYANNDTMAIGVSQAIIEAGKEGQILVIGTDGVPEAISAVRNGAMEATVSPLPFYEGYWAVEAAVRLLRGEEVKPWIVAPAQLITKENVDEYYSPDGLVLEGLYK